MSSRSVVEGDREPVESRDYAPKSGDSVSVPERSSTDHVARTDNPDSTGSEIAKPTNRRGSRAQPTRGSPSQSTKSDDYPPQAQSVGLVGLVRETLKSDDMTRRAGQLMLTGAVCFVIVAAPVAAIAFIVMTKAPADWKYILGLGTPIFIALGSWLFVRHWNTKKSRRALPTGSSEDPAEDN
jgi:hypothetical protein